LAKAGDEKEAESPLQTKTCILPGRKTAGLVSLREIRMNAAHGEVSF